MMDRLMNAIRQQIAAQMAQQGQHRWGIVQSVDPSRPAAKVLIEPEGVMSGWLPIISTAAAGGWGLTVIPVPGMMAYLSPDLGDAQHLVITGFGHNDLNRPASVPNAPGSGGTRATAGAAQTGGEFLLAHQSGAFIRLTAGGNILMSAPTVQIDGNLTVNGTTTGYGTITSTNGDVVSSTGNVTAAVDIIDRAGSHGSVKTLRDAYNAHTHTQNADSHGDTEQPTNTTSLPV